MCHDGVLTTLAPPSRQHRTTLQISVDDEEKRKGPRLCRSPWRPPCTMQGCRRAAKGPHQSRHRADRAKGRTAATVVCLPRRDVRCSHCKGSGTGPSPCHHQFRPWGGRASGGNETGERRRRGGWRRWARSPLVSPSVERDTGASVPPYVIRPTAGSALALMSKAGNSSTAVIGSGHRSPGSGLSGTTSAATARPAADLPVSCSGRAR